MPAETPYSIPREVAALRLHVSTRTLDRWLKTGKLRARMINRSVMIHAADVEKWETESPIADPEPTHAAAPRGRDAAPIEPPIDDADDAPPHIFEGETRARSADAVYQKLYEEAANELRAKQEKLEAAHFRVGQLETALKNTVPLLEHKAVEEKMRQTQEILASENLRLRTTVDTEQLKSWIFMGAAGVLAFVALVFGVLLMRG